MKRNFYYWRSNLKYGDEAWAENFSKCSKPMQQIMAKRDFFWKCAPEILQNFFIVNSGLRKLAGDQSIIQAPMEPAWTR